MSKVLFVYPNQLFANHPGLEESVDRAILIEDPLFFGDSQYPLKFHKQKIWLHKASMARYRLELESNGIPAKIILYKNNADLIRDVLNDLRNQGVSEIVVADLVDFIAEKRLQTAIEEIGLKLTVLPTPGFLNTRQDNHAWFNGRKRWVMGEFYKYQRRRLGVMMNGDEPLGQQWSFDEENRKKVPKKLLREIPEIPSLERDAIDIDARAKVNAQFPGALGSLETLYYPSSHADAAIWLDAFLEHRFKLFGDYEDAIVEGESWLWHSVLTPMLNVGLLTPRQVLDAALEHAEVYSTPINSLEGFVRQVIGWREFMRATYEGCGVEIRTTNHWQHTRKIPSSFYDATTGIDPIDDAIKRILKTGYCHHIERLMVLGGFMFLCEFDPHDVYRWFMEMFVDSYDWVMVPNVYAMSQHADGGLITTKPYFSGSNYVRKMSHWPKGEWADIWDGLYWRFIFKHSKTLAGNPRWAMMCRAAVRMKDETRETHLRNAEKYLTSL